MADPQVLPSGKPRNFASQSLVTNNTLAVWARAGRTHRYPCGDGLYFQTRPTRASWIFRFRFGGARRAMGLGAFPEVGLAVAREKVDRARLALRQGRDPIAEREAGATHAQAPQLLVKWVERKWPSPPFPVEVTSQITELLQEVTALRRKVTVLEQALAQQRPMAKAERQEGLGMKAVKAAMTKPNGGVVGFYDANFEFHEAGSPPPYPLLFDPWVPPEVQPAMAAMWESTLPKEVRMPLQRLATKGEMRGVWKKLRNEQGIAEIIPAAIEALWMFEVRRPPPQSKRREALQRFQRHLDKLQINHPNPTKGLLTCATAAIDMRYVLEDLRRVLAPYGDEIWSRYWRGDPAMNSLGAAITFLARLQDCLVAINDEQRSDDRKLPPATGWDSRARQRYLARCMTDKMRELCRRPRRDVVAALVCVACNVDDVTTDTVEDWCKKTG